MSMGFAATNKYGHVLVDQNMRNLHYYGKATYYQLVAQFDTCGGSRLYRFSSDCPSTPVPFFTAPPTDNTYGITRVFKSGNLWFIDILQGSVGGLIKPNIPEVYIFSDLYNRKPPSDIASTEYGTFFGVTIPIKNTFRTPTHGIRVNGPLGPSDVASFDSRYKPLAVADGITVYPPYRPFNNDIVPGGGYGYWDGQYLNNDALFGNNYDSPSLSASFMSKNRVNFRITTGLTATKPIYSYSSLAQCERDQSFGDHADWYTKQGFWWVYGGTLYASSMYWCFYRSAIGVNPDKSVYCAWAPAKKGYAESHSRSAADNSVGNMIIGGVVGGLTGGLGGALVGVALAQAISNDPNSSTGDSGVWPYSNETLNTNPSAVIIADGAFYD